MNRLCSAEFSRLWRNKYFWLCTGVMFVYLVLYMVSRCRIVLEDMTESEKALEDYYFQFSLVIGLFSAVFTTLFLGQEYGDGVIRNKIIAGHSRRNIYLSHLILTFAASFLMLLAGMAGSLVGIPVLGLWEMDGGTLFSYLLITVMFTLTFCSIYTYINVFSHNKISAAVLTILAFFALLFLAGKLEERLSEPGIVFSDISITNDKVTFNDPMQNPRYVDGVKRKVLDLIVDLLPTGQGERVAYLKAAHPVRMLLSSVLLTILVTLFGMFRFERKDLK